MLAEAPARILQLPRDPRGYPIPWFVETLEEGRRDFRIMSSRNLVRAVNENRCWVCGGRNHPLLTFTIGPMCAINLTSAEPPSHPECARWSARACPFLTQPRMKRNERGLPEERKVAGLMIARNPGVTLLWTTRRFKPWSPGRGEVLFEIGKPVRLEWFAEGRAATRAEVLTSISTGLPALLEAAALDGPEGLAELERRRVATLELVPAAVPTVAEVREAIAQVKTAFGS